jgi:hypothetical protein
VAFFVVENINGRFWLNDFKVYYTAASRLLSGGNIYHEAFGLGSGFYKYSPFAAFFFIPLSLLPYSIASSVYFFIIVVLIIYVLNVSFELISIYFNNENSKYSNHKIIMLYAFLICVVNLQRELHLGNVNVLLLAILLFSIKEILGNKMLFPAILFGITILFKPHFLILFPLLILRKEYKVLIVSFITIVIGLFIPSIIIGFNRNIELLAQWIDTMKAHNSGIVDAEQTIYFILNHYLLRFITDDSRIIFMIVCAMIASLFIFIFIKQRKENKELSNQDFLVNSFLLLALIPSITFTDTEHFILSLPLIAYLIYYIRTIKVKPLFLILFCFGILFYGGNIHDLLGSSLSQWVLFHGVLGIGNLILIMLFIYSMINSKFAIKIN